MPACGSGYPTPVLKDVQRSLFQLLTSCKIEDNAFLAPGNVALATAKNCRDDNQDRAIFVRFRSILPRHSFAMFAVCDGIGGLKEGGRCADIALTSILSHLITVKSDDPKLRIVKAIETANASLFERYQERGGTTLAIVFITENSVIAANVGDSRIYICGGGAAMNMISVEDRLGERIKEAVGLELAEIDPQFANRLAQFIGMGGELKVHTSIIEQSIQESTILITTDGAHAWVDTAVDSNLSQVTAEAICRGLIDRSADKGEQDNATAICYKGDVFRLVPGIDQASSSNLLEIWSPWRNAVFCQVEASREASTPNCPAPKQGKRSKTSNRKQSEPKIEASQPELPSGGSKKEQLIIEQQLPFDHEPSSKIHKNI